MSKTKGHERLQGGERVLVEFECCGFETWVSGGGGGIAAVDEALGLHDAQADHETAIHTTVPIGTEK